MIKSKEGARHSILKICASTTDRIGPKPLYQHIVELAREKGISGATVHRGIMGYGSSSRISSSRFWELTEKLPVVIELVDETSKLESFYTEIEGELLSMPKGCLVTLEPAHLLLQKKGKK
jgi:PII-like signaling protein